MKTCVIMGPSNVGKTETIKIIKKHFADNNVASCRFCDKDKNSKNDIICAYEYNNQLIGIISLGDYEDGIKEAYNEIIARVKSVDYLICASRSKGRTIEYIESLSNDIVKIRKSYLDTKDEKVIYKYKDQLNNDLAKFIYDNLFDLFDK